MSQLVRTRRGPMGLKSAPSVGIVTGPQVPGGRGVADQRLAPYLGADGIKKIRDMRGDPTIALARMVFAAPILMAEWSLSETDDAPPDAKELIERTFVARRARILESAVFGCMDFGWQAYEKIFKRDPVDDRLLTMRLKPLLQDFTEILADEDTGAFIGLLNTAWVPRQGLEFWLPLKKSLLVSWDVEGTDWYGQSTTNRANGPYDSWNETEETARRFDRKVAGSHWVVYYPDGYSSVNGEILPNDQVADGILLGLEAAGRIKVPATIAAQVDDMNQERPGWKIDLLQNAQTTGQFTERQRYADVLKVRAYGLPERTLMEGEHGTKAESAEHMHLAIVNMELRHQTITDGINDHAVNHLLRLNWGREAEGTVKIYPAKIDERMRQFLRDLYGKIISSPDGFLSEVDMLDMEGIRDELGIPSVRES